MAPTAAANRTPTTSAGSAPMFMISRAMTPVRAAKGADRQIELARDHGHADAHRDGTDQHGSHRAAPQCRSEVCGVVRKLQGEHQIDDQAMNAARTARSIRASRLFTSPPPLEHVKPAGSDDDEDVPTTVVRQPLVKSCSSMKFCSNDDEDRRRELHLDWGIPGLREAQCLRRE